MTTDADGGERTGLSPGELHHAPPSEAVAAPAVEVVAGTTPAQRVINERVRPW